MNMKNYTKNSTSKKTGLGACALALCSLLSGCASQSPPPISAVSKVDLPRFMGDWYVIACIPTFIETEAYNAIESYKLEADGSIDTTFTFRKGGFDGEPKRYNPHGYVIENTNNAVWGMQFIWPIKSEYIIAHLDDDYGSTIIARNARDYVWIMARSPSLPDAKYSELTTTVARLGYDIAKLRKVPQQWGATDLQKTK
jgi:apolipoprotein D and lipocalin family protein